MKVKRIAGGYYHITYLGYCFSLERGALYAWRLYMTNSCFDHNERLVVSRTKKEAMDILKNYTEDFIKWLPNSKWSKIEKL